MKRTIPVAFCMAAFVALSAHVPPASAGEIHQLARKGNVERLSLLLEAGSDANEVDGSGETPLFVAAKWGQLATVKILLKAGADPLIAPMGPFGSLGTPLHAAAKAGHVDITRYLLEAGVNPNLPDAGSGPPLHVALSRGRKEVAQLLITHGAKSRSALPVDKLLANADIALGKKIAGTCRSCHDLTKEGAVGKKIGPPLWNIVGRKKASLPGFTYSNALLEQGGDWDYSQLNSFVANPRAFLPGTKMSALSGIASQGRRAALILYLRSLADSPKPLP